MDIQDTLDTVANQATVGFLAIAVPQEPMGHQVYQDILASLDLADLACLDILDSADTLDQEFLDSQDLVVQSVHQAFQDILDSVELAPVDLVATAGFLDSVASLVSVDQGFLVILDFLVPRALQDLAGFLDSVVPKAHQDLVGSAVPQDPMEHQASVDIVAIQDQAFRATAGFLAPVVSKVHRSISKAQWPHRPICQPLETMSMMPILFHPMAIYMFGLGQFGIMSAK